ncbi:hypothetical protein OEZ85_002276 [Tetradesmus obliquus]|uniref:Clathrin/coatomer adaptor adaptin-like N-terminal domain-containing protein n=1 Tax=Tetradesmus obliquus TaxID=3088 RepID=A0ABY8U355_TETOB|nr:hypothetical protein OEZ85_002276 [Tetradesmus obliquus]
MSQDRIQAQLKGLGHASPLFRRQAAYGVFALLQAQPGLQKDAANDIILACITDRHTDVVEEAVAQLRQLATAAAAAGGKGVVNAEDALHLLLLALTTAGAATAPCCCGGATLQRLGCKPPRH